MEQKFFYPKHTYEDLKEKFENYIHNPEDIKNIDKAYEFAKVKHEGQFRKSGEPYIIHLIEVAYILAELNAGPATLIAGLLHDTVEDCNVSLDEIEQNFSLEIRNMVDALTKIQALSRRKDKEFLAESHRKIFIAMSRDIRVIIIKLSDRLHNMRTLFYMPEEKRKRIANETLEVYAPIAHRLGINVIKSELEDLSLYYLQPDIYEEIESLLNNSTFNRQKNIKNMEKKIANMLIDKNIKFDISARIKSIYSIYKKMFVKNKKFEEIYDIMAIRIITETEVNCYEILGYIHSIYKPIPGRFKDYIAMPKPNLYQSLHTTIVANDGNIYEIQIRTKEMNAIAESGVAAHWRYKEGEKYDPKKEQKEIEEKLHWLSDFKTYEQSSADAQSYMNALQRDIFDANVYVFTPLGKVIDLPAGSTPLDFAYKIHTKVGDSTIGALVNGVMVPLTYQLQTGDVCEIKTSKNSQGPNEGWLNIVKTSLARNHIRKYLTKKNALLSKEENIHKGKQLLFDEMKEFGYSEKQIIKLLQDSKALEKYPYDNLDDLFVGISQKNPMASQLVDFLGLRQLTDAQLLEKFNEKNSKRKINNSQTILVSGADQLKVSVAPCCSPLPGDKIIGFVSKGKGIKVHRVECPNIKDEVRLIPVMWNPNLKDQLFPVNIEVDSNDRNNLLVDVMSLLSQMKVPCQKIAAKMHKDTVTVQISITVMLASLAKMQDLFNALINVEGVYDIKRIMK